MSSSLVAIVLQLVVVLQPVAARNRDLLNQRFDRARVNGQAFHGVVTIIGNAASMLVEIATKPLGAVGVDILSNILSIGRKLSEGSDSSVWAMQITLLAL